MDLRAIRRHARAVFVAFHVVAVCVLAAPQIPLDASIWRDPTTQAEFDAWGRRLNIAPARLQAFALTVARGFTAAQARVTRPLQPYIELSGIAQPWQLFIAPDRVPARFQFQARRAGQREFETLFEERSSEFAWHREFFDAARTRRALYWYAWPLFAEDAAWFCHWLANEAFAERRELDEVRCRHYRARSPSPAEVRAGTEPAGAWVGNWRVGRAYARRRR